MATRVFQRVMDKALQAVETDKLFGSGRDCKPTGRQWRDVYCPDGVIASGNRIIKAGGVICFGGIRWQDDLLIPLVGKLVGCHMGDVYCLDIDVFWGGYPMGQHLMTVNTCLPSKQDVLPQKDPASNETHD